MVGAASPSSDSRSEGVSTLKMILTVLNLLGVLVLGMTTWWVTQQNSKSDAQDARLNAQELRIATLETQRTANERSTEKDHDTLVRLSSEMGQRTVTLENAVLLMREMKTAMDSLTVQYIAMRESLVRIEQQRSDAGRTYRR